MPSTIGRRVDTVRTTEHLPWALGGTDLGDDVLEVGPGYGATTDATALAYDDGRFSGAARFETARPLRPASSARQQ
jgi:hypothetical protein